MQRGRLIGFVTAILAAGQPASGQIGPEVVEPPVVSPVVEQSVLVPPLVEQEAVKETVTQTQFQFTFQLPTVFTNPLVPTDISGIGGGLGHARGIGSQIPLSGAMPGGKGKPAILIARDSDYEFLGQWIPFAFDMEHKFEAGSGHDRSGQSKSSERSKSPSQTGKVERWDLLDRDGDSVFMPTRNARYEEGRKDELNISKGAVLVKAGKQPVHISANLEGKDFTAKITAGALALVSVVGDRLLVLNLTDRASGAVVLYLPGEHGGAHHVGLGVSEIVEIHKSSDKPQSDHVAVKLLSERPLDESLHIRTARCHYVAAMRRFSLDKALSYRDFNRVLKTAAAMAYVNRSSAARASQLSSKTPVASEDASARGGDANVSARPIKESSRPGKTH